MVSSRCPVQARPKKGTQLAAPCPEFPTQVTQFDLTYLSDFTNKQQKSGLYTNTDLLMNMMDAGPCFSKFAGCSRGGRKGRADWKKSTFAFLREFVAKGSKEVPS